LGIERDETGGICVTSIETILNVVAEIDDRYLEARTTVSAFSKVLTASLDEGQRILFDQILDAQQRMRAIEWKVAKTYGRCQA